jgi:hypothetical protein
MTDKAPMNTLMRAAAVMGIAALLFGCATAAQRQLLGMAANNRDASQKFQDCVAAIYNQPELEPLRRDLPLNVQNASLAQLANPNFVSAEETRLILANHPRYQACRQEFIAQVSQTMPTVAEIFLKAATAFDNRTVALLQKKLHWGEFLQQARQAGLDNRAELEAEGRRIMASLERSHEAELERRQAAIQAFGNALAEYGRTQQAIANMNRPVNCLTQTIMPGYSSMTSCH